jgi:hypothetical protein
MLPRSVDFNRFPLRSEFAAPIMLDKALHFDLPELVPLGLHGVCGLLASSVGMLVNTTSVLPVIRGGPRVHKSGGMRVNLHMTSPRKP